MYTRKRIDINMHKRVMFFLILSFHSE